MPHNNSRGGGRRLIVVLAVAGLAAATTVLAAYWHERSRDLVDTGETRASVEASLRRLLPAAVDSSRDERLIAAAERLQGERYVASVWLVDGLGEITLHWHGPGRVGDNVGDMVKRDMGRVLEAMPAGALTGPQELQLLAIAAIRRDGEHNDVFRHMVRTVQDRDGDPVALVVLAYDVNPAISAPPTARYILPLLLALAGFVTYWFGLPLWVYLDARARGEAATLWGIFILMTNLVGLVAYLIVVSRPRHGQAG